MKKRMGALAVAVMLAGLAAAATPPVRPDGLDTVIVNGTRPTSGLWKVSKDKHVLWVLAGNLPLPTEATWQKVEARIAESQEVLDQADSHAYVDVGALTMTKLVMGAARTGNAPVPDKKDLPDDKYLPGKQTLKDVLPADTWGTWLDLRRKYIGTNDDVDRYRPAAAVQALETAAYNAVWLAAFPGSGQRRVGISDAFVLAKKHKVRIHVLRDIERKVKVENPRDLVTGANKLALPDVDCFTTVVSTLESRLEWRKAELAAWALGDLKELRRLHVESYWRRYGGSCTELEEALDFAEYIGWLVHESVDASKVKALADEVRRNQEQANVQAQEKWFAAVRAALRKNKSTFAVASLHEILGQNGFIEKLRALGYTIEDPT